MDKNMKSLIKNESGEVMIEAALIMVLVIALCFMLISLGFLFYQQVLVNDLACETATEIARNYKLTAIETGMDQHTFGPDEASKLKMYRLMFSDSSKNAHQMRAESYLPGRLSYTSLGLNSEKPKVEVQIVSDSIGRAHVEARVSVKCEIFLGGILQYLKIIDTPKLEFSAVARSEIIDITAYAGNAKFMRFVLDKSIFDPANNIAESGKNISATIDTMQSIFSKVVGWFQ